MCRNQWRMEIPATSSYPCCAVGDGNAVSTNCVRRIRTARSTSLYDASMVRTATTVRRKGNNPRRTSELLIVGDSALIGHLRVPLNLVPAYHIYLVATRVTLPTRAPHQASVDTDCAGLDGSVEKGVDPAPDDRIARVRGRPWPRSDVSLSAPFAIILRGY